MYAGLLNNEVIILEETYRQYPPDALGTPVETVECDDTVILGMIYDPESGLFFEPEYDTTQSEVTEPIETSYSETELINEYTEGVENIG